MKKVKKLLAMALAIVMICGCIPFSASAITYGDANYDGEVDVRDVVRAKRFALTTEPEINMAAIDYWKDNLVDETDIERLKTTLIGETFYSYFREDVAVNEQFATSAVNEWDMTKEANGEVSISYVKGRQHPRFSLQKQVRIL